MVVHYQLMILVLDPNIICSRLQKIVFIVHLGKGRFKIKLTTEAEEKVNASRNLIDQIVKENRVVYGITTGFGKFARTVIEKGRILV